MVEFRAILIFWSAGEERSVGDEGLAGSTVIRTDLAERRSRCCSLVVESEASGSWMLGRGIGCTGGGHFVGDGMLARRVVSLSEVPIRSSMVLVIRLAVSWDLRVTTACWVAWASRNVWDAVSPVTISARSVLILLATVDLGSSDQDVMSCCSHVINSFIYLVLSHSQFLSCQLFLPNTEDVSVCKLSTSFVVANTVH